MDYKLFELIMTILVLCICFVSFRLYVASFSGLSMFVIL